MVHVFLCEDVDACMLVVLPEQTQTLSLRQLGVFTRPWGIESSPWELSFYV